ncbi:hypothetical protein BDZ45DRAFT_695169 [Acephala macrosclerotiorum]|nr:hypothetical protein BDZ45DRAFT_695169 [Acephala macrosclerotiorum]
MTDANFSTLEAINPGFEPFRKEKPLPAESGKQVISEDGGKQVVVPYSDIEVNAQHQPTQKNLEPPVVENERPRRSRKWLWIGGAVLLVVILAAVLGGVLGLRQTQKSSSPASTSTANATSSNNIITSHRIAATAYGSNSINNTRVYYLADDGALTEAASSTSNTTWGFTKLGYPEKNDSVLAAAVSRPNFPLEISVYYTDENYLVHDLVYNSTTHKWAQGAISAENYITHPNSSLTAMYNQCQLCANTTIVAYQDINGFVQIANYTLLQCLPKEGMNSSQATEQILPLNTQRRCASLALHPFMRANQWDQINLYYQQSTLNISLACQFPGNSGTSANNYWSNACQTYDIGVSGTPLAAASAYTNVTTGYESWVQLLQLSDTGIEVNTWSGNINDWLEQDNHPSPMANSTVNVKTYRRSGH